MIMSPALTSVTLDTDNQRVIIKVKDINDEPPYFINRPLPMQIKGNASKSKATKSASLVGVPIHPPSTNP